MSDTTDVLQCMRVLALLDEAGAYSDGPGIPQAEIMSVHSMTEPECSVLMRAMCKERLLECSEPGVYAMTPVGVAFYTHNIPDFSESELLPPVVVEEEPTPSEEDIATRLREELELDDFEPDEHPLDGPTAIESIPASNGSLHDQDEPTPSSKKARKQRRSRTIEASETRLATPKRLTRSTPPPLGTLEAEVYGYVKTHGWIGGVPEITKWCAKWRFSTTEKEVQGIIDDLIKCQLIEEWRNDDPEAPLAYRLVPDYMLEQAA